MGKAGQSLTPRGDLVPNIFGPGGISPHPPGGRRLGEMLPQFFLAQLKRFFGPKLQGVFFKHHYPEVGKVWPPGGDLEPKIFGPGDIPPSALWSALWAKKEKSQRKKKFAPLRGEQNCNNINLKFFAWKWGTMENGIALRYVCVLWWM